MATQPDDKGKLEVAVRILGNELVALKMEVDDFKMKWLLISHSQQLIHYTYRFKAHKNSPTLPYINIYTSILS